MIIIFPTQLIFLTNLNQLNVHNNRLTVIPDNISLLSNLTSLQLSNNFLTHLPNTLHTFTHLREFFLSNNLLQSLPTQFHLIKNTYIKQCAYQLNNLDNYLTYLHINDLSLPLHNLPISLKEIRIYNPIPPINIKLPYDCLLFINDVLFYI